MSELSQLSVSARRRLGAIVAAFAALFLLVGLVAALGDRAASTLFSVIAIVIAVPLALIAWGLANSAALDLADQRLDSAITEAIGDSDVLSCGCGHDHDPDEMHVSSSATCAHDGAGIGAEVDGTSCSRDCANCVLAGLRPATQ